MNGNLGYLLQRMQKPANKAGRLPNTDTVANLPKADRKSARDIAKRYQTQYTEGLELRRQHAIRWMRVISILNGVHYFDIDSFGTWYPLKRADRNEVRAVVPVMDPYYRWEHGRLSANQIGVTATPTTGTGKDSFYKAKIAQDVMTHWVKEIDIEGVDDEANQQLLVYGMYAYYVEKVPHKQQSFVRCFPQCELMPIPYDSRNWREMDGIMRTITVSKDWLEMQDELAERRASEAGQPPPAMKMASKSGTHTTQMHSRFAGFSTNMQWGSKFDGATVKWIWTKPTEVNPHGEHLFMVEDEIFGYVSGLDEKGRKIALEGDDLPLRPVYYTKKPHDWWGYGFCGGLVPMQLEANRQMSDLIMSARFSRGFLGYNSTLINSNDIQDSVTGLVPFRDPGIETRVNPLLPVPGHSMGNDIGAVLNIVDEWTKRAAMYESDILKGQQEKRTEGGPATNLLNTNAQAPLQPILDRKYRAFERVYTTALEQIREVWPDEKRIQVQSINGLARDMAISRDDIPGIQEVHLSPLPLIVNGRGGMINMMMTLRSIPADDGKPLITSRELRRSLQMLNMSPPGLELFDKAEQRIRWRIGQLINDGKQPAIPAALQVPGMQGIEDHEMFILLLRDEILDPAYMMYSPIVQKALQQELQFHNEQRVHTPPNDKFDQDSDDYEARQAENMLDAAENNPDTLDGIFSMNGVPIS